MVWVIDNLVTLGEQFAEVATADPLSVPLLVAGAAVMAVSVGGFGLLALGGLVNWVRPESSGRAPRPRAE